MEPEPDSEYYHSLGMSVNLSLTQKTLPDGFSLMISTRRHEQVMTCCVRLCVCVCVCLCMCAQLLPQGPNCSTQTEWCCHHYKLTCHISRELLHHLWHTKKLAEASLWTRCFIVSLWYIIWSLLLCEDAQWTPALPLWVKYSKQSRNIHLRHAFMCLEGVTGRCLVCKI